MSHVAQVDVEIKNLDDLEAACKRIGLELMRGQTTYRWFGESVGDYPLPPGVAVEDLGKCLHAIRIPLDHPAYKNREFEQPYEIGVIARRDGLPGYQLVWDFFLGGMGLWKFVGGISDAEHEHDGQMPKLKQAYAICATRRAAQAQGFRLQEQPQPNGSVKMVLTR